MHNRIVLHTQQQYQLLPMCLFVRVGAHVCACSCLYATSVCVSVCICLWAVLERYCPATGSALHYSTDQASQYTLKGNLNKGKEKNKTAKAEVVL